MTLEDVVLKGALWNQWALGKHGHDGPRYVQNTTL